VISGHFQIDICQGRHILCDHVFLAVATMNIRENFELLHAPDGVFNAYAKPRMPLIVSFITFRKHLFFAFFNRGFCFRPQIAQIPEHKHIRRLDNTAFIKNPLVVFGAFLRWPDSQNTLVVIRDNLMNRRVALLFPRIVSLALAMLFRALDRPLLLRHGII
jgi:hypothetical protein